MNFKNKVVLITGANTGIGKATAIEFAKLGANVIVDYIEKEQEAFDLIKNLKELGSDSICIKCDVSKEDEVISMIEQIIKKFGKIDVLVNNAGIVFDVPLFNKTMEQRNQTLGSNLYGTYFCSKYVAKHMLEQKSGSIVNISSTNSTNAFSPESIDYDVSKAGINLLTKNFAKELGPYIRVNAIAPGWVDTDMNKDLPKEFLDDEIAKTFIKRIARPEEIANIVVFLASDKASYINGSIIIADGGV